MRKATEHEIQKAIVDAVRLCPFLTVYETTAYRQKGGSGVDKGIPDLLISYRFIHFTFLGLEVKADAANIKWSSEEQRRAFLEKRIAVTDSPGGALAAIREWIEERWKGREKDIAFLSDMAKLSTVARALKEAARA